MDLKNIMEPPDKPPGHSTRDKERIKKLFQQLDVNQDGRIDVEEINRGLSKLGINSPGEAEVRARV